MGTLSKVIRDGLLKLGNVSALTDGELLEGFVLRREEEAFRELVRRHGPMVLRVCQRVLRRVQDAEDAFQATFIVLARKAESVVKVESLGSWLHRVAFRIALAASERERRKHERPLNEYADRDEPSQAEASDLRCVLDEEVNRLPPRFRAVVVLHYLEGRPCDDVARELGCQIDAIHKRLERARGRLRGRLERRGVTLSVAGLAALLVKEAPAATLPLASLAAAVKGASGSSGTAGASAATLVLAEQFLHQAARRKLTWTAALLLLVGGASAAVAWGLHATRSAENASSLAAGDVQPFDLPRDSAPYRRAVLAGRHLALGNSAGGVSLFRIEWEAAPPRLRRLPLHLEGLHTSLAFSSDGRKLALGRLDGTVQLFDPDSGSKLATLQTDRPGKVSELAFAPDGLALAGLVDQVGLTTWNLQTLSVRSHVPLPEHKAVQLVYTFQNELLAINSNYQAHCWDATTGQAKHLHFPAVPVVGRPGVPRPTKGNAVALTVDGNMVVLLDDGSIHLWSRATNRVEYLYTLEREHLDNVSFLAGPRGDTVACIFHKPNRVQLWDVAAKRELWGRRFEGGILCQGYSADGQKFFVAALEHELRPGMTGVPMVYGLIDLEMRRKQVADARRN